MGVFPFPPTSFIRLSVVCFFLFFRLNMQMEADERGVPCILHKRICDHISSSSDAWGGSSKKQNKMRMPGKCKSGIGRSCWASGWLWLSLITKRIFHYKTRRVSFFFAFSDDPTLDSYCDVSPSPSFFFHSTFSLAPQIGWTPPS